MPAIPSIRASVLTPIVARLDSVNGTGDMLLAAHGILRSQLGDPYALVPMARYIALFEQAAVEAGDPFLGARLGAALRPGDLGPIGMLFSLSPTIRVAFTRLSRYVSVLQGATGSGLVDEDDRVLWSYRLVDPAMWPRRQDSEFTLSTSCQLLRSCFGPSWRPLEIHLEHPAPRDPELLRRLFRAPVRFDQPSNAIVIAAADAARVHRTEDRDLVAILERHLADLADEADEAPGLKEKVQSLIGIYLGHKPVTIAAIAAELGLSPRTLQRRLSDAGLSLREMLRDHRRALAAHHMAAAEAPMSKIAESLGYADSTVFWRARRAWSRRDG